MRRAGLAAALIAAGCAHTAPPPRVASAPPAALAPPPAPPPAPPSSVSLPTTSSPPSAPLSDAPVYQSGNATWYGDRLAGHKTASGERFDPNAFTAAHRRLPLGTWVEVRRRGTTRAVRVRINDRGPFGTPDKIIDLSRAAFEQLGSLREGVIAVEVRLVAP
jgi:rare lipoprotein A